MNTFLVCISLAKNKTPLYGGIMTNESAKKEFEQAARILIHRAHPDPALVSQRPGGTQSYSAVFPADRHDVCVVRRSVDNGKNYGYDTIYLVWRNEREQMRQLWLIDSSESRDYIRIDSIRIQTDKAIVAVKSGGMMSGRGAWNETFEIDLKTARKLNRS